MVMPDHADRGLGSYFKFIVLHVVCFFMRNTWQPQKMVSNIYDLKPCPILCTTYQNREVVIVLELLGILALLFR